MCNGYRPWGTLILCAACRGFIMHALYSGDVMTSRFSSAISAVLVVTITMYRYVRVVRLGLFTAMTVKIGVFWDVRLCILVNTYKMSCSY